MLHTQGTLKAREGETNEELTQRYGKPIEETSKTRGYPRVLSG